MFISVWNYLERSCFIFISTEQRFIPQVILENQNKYFLDDLEPGVFYNLTIKQFKGSCPHYTYAYVKTNPWGLDLTSIAQSK